MTNHRPPQIKADHLARVAVGYLRQSTPEQVRRYTGSTSHQRSQVEYALAWGWPAESIEVLDVDLGLSGTSGDRRPGWRSLLRRVAAGEIGIILTADTSRLVRSSADFEVLLRLCEETDTLLAVEGVIADLGDPANKLLARMRANFAEYENENRTNSLMADKRKKAKEGHAVTTWPAGYVSPRKGVWVMDPDPAVQDAILEVFRQYQALGSIGKVVRFFVANDLLIPTRGSNRKKSEEPAQEGVPMGEEQERTKPLKWVVPRRQRIREILANPSYAGYFILRRHPKRRRRSRRTKDGPEG